MADTAKTDETLGAFKDCYKLNKTQWQIFDYIHKLLTNEKFKKRSRTCVFIDGTAGSGKTEVITAICDFVTKTFSKGEHEIIMVTTATGLELLNRAGGIFAQSVLDFINFSPRRRLGKCDEQLKNCSLIVFDDVSIVHRNYIELIDKRLRKLMKCRRIFGGKVMLFAGDFRQPTAKKNNPNNPSPQSLIQSTLWPKLKKYILPDRTLNDASYSQFLLNVGIGCEPTVSEESNEINSVRLENIEILKLKDLISFVFPPNILANPASCTKRAILTPLNKSAAAINNIVLKNYLPGDIISCPIVGETSEVTRFKEIELFFPEDDSLPESELELKIGCICAVTRDIYSAVKMLTGTKVIIESVSKEYVIVHQPNTGRICKIDKAEYEIDLKSLGYTSKYNFRELPEVLKLDQFPLRVCFAMSIQNTQGHTLDKLGLDLRESVSGHGHLYLALSRVREPRNIKVMVKDDQIQDNVAVVNNIVHRDLVMMYINERSTEIATQDDLCHELGAMAI